MQTDEHHEHSPFSFSLSILASADSPSDQPISGPLTKLRHKLSDACTIVRQSKYFHPISDKVPHTMLMKVSDRLIISECNNPEEPVVSQRTYKVKPRNANELLPGLQRDADSADKLPTLLAHQHGRITSLQESVIARSCHREVELSHHFFYPVLVAGLI